MGVLQDLKSKLDQSKKAFGKLTENALKIGSYGQKAFESQFPETTKLTKQSLSGVTKTDDFAVSKDLFNIGIKILDIPSSFGAGVSKEYRATGKAVPLPKIIPAGVEGIKKRFSGDTSYTIFEEAQKRLSLTGKLGFAVGLGAEIITPGIGAAESRVGKNSIDEAVKIAREVRGSADDLLKAGNTVEARKLFRPVFKAIEDISNSKIPKEEMVSKIKAIKGSLPDFFKKEADVVIDALKASKSEIVDNKFLINKSRLALKSTAEKNLDDVIKNIKPELESLIGKPISHEEVIKAAKASEIIKKVVSREAQIESQAAVLRTRQALTNLANEVDALQKGGNNAVKVSELSKELSDSLKVVRSLSRSAGAGLESWKTVAGDVPERLKIVDEIIEKLGFADKEIDNIVKASEGVNFNNIDEVIKFYRGYVKPTKWDVLNEYRYVNILSNPRTHIVNTFTNISQAATRPVDKLASGGIDFISSTLTGKQREMYISEVPEYIRGSLNSIPNAFKEAWKVFQGGVVERPDLIRIPTGSIPKWYTTPLRALEASDVFFRKIITDGEYESLIYRELRKSGGKELGENTVSMIRKQAEDIGRNYVFRGELGDASQGVAFKALDKLTLGVKELADKIRVGKLLIPFFDTPVNILKQGIERTPGVGLIALPGAANKTEILGKQLVGSTIFMGAGYLAMTDRTTWSTPKGKNESARFYAEGKQPYAIKVGDKWYQYNRLGPLGFPIAFAAALKAKFQEDENRQDKGEDPRGLPENIARSIMAMTSFFGDQSYVENVGETMKVLLDEDYDKLERIVANTATQFIPLDALLGMVSRVVDDTYRHPENVPEYIAAQMPYLSGFVEPYYTPGGLPSKRQNRLFNALSPVSVTEEKSLGPTIKMLKPTLKLKPKSTVKLKIKDK